MQTLINAIKGHVAAMIAALGANRIGVVTAVDNTRHLVRVAVQPEGDQSGWLPVNSHWGISILPAPGQQVLLAPQEHDGEHMHVLAGVFSSQAAPPMAPTASLGTLNQAGNTPTHVTPGTEILLTNQSGAVIRLLPDGSIYIKGRVVFDSDVTINGNVSVAGNLLVAENIEAALDITDRLGSVNGLRAHYNVHEHPGIQPGSGVTGTTTRPDP